ncbi:MAG: hypothetical protein V4534_08680 [Myxococcota bacterium]
MPIENNPVSRPDTRPSDVRQPQVEREPDSESDGFYSAQGSRQNSTHDLTAVHAPATNQSVAGETVSSVQAALTRNGITPEVMNRRIAAVYVDPGLETSWRSPAQATFQGDPTTPEFNEVFRQSAQVSVQELPAGGIPTDHTVNNHIYVVQTNAPVNSLTDAEVDKVVTQSNVKLSQERLNTKEGKLVVLRTQDDKSIIFAHRNGNQATQAAYIREVVGLVVPPADVVLGRRLEVSQRRIVAETGSQPAVKIDGLNESGLILSDNSAAVSRTANRPTGKIESIMSISLVGEPGEQHYEAAISLPNKWAQNTMTPSQWHTALVDGGSVDSAEADLTGELNWDNTLKLEQRNRSHTPLLTLTPRFKLPDGTTFTANIETQLEEVHIGDAGAPVAYRMEQDGVDTKLILEFNTGLTGARTGTFKFPFLHSPS